MPASSRVCALIAVAALLPGCLDPGASPSNAPPDTDPAPDSTPPEDTAPADDTAAPPGKDIVVLFTLDTVRWESFNTATMPTVMGLAAEGLWVPELWHAGSWTYMGCTAINTGHSPIDFGAAALVPTNGVLPVLPEDAVTLGELATGAGISAAWRTESRICGDATHQEQGWEFRIAGTEAGSLVSEGLAWLDEHQDGKSLLWLHSRGGHDPYDTLDSSCEAEALATGTECPYDMESTDGSTTWSVLADMNAAYTADPTAAFWPACDARAQALNSCKVTAADAEVSELLTGITQLGLRGRVTLILLADHGEGWNVEHEQLNHGNNLFAGLTRGAAVVWQSGMTPSVVTSPASQLDVFPTILELLGIRPEPTPGVSLLQPVPAERTLNQFWCSTNQLGSGGVRNGRHYLRYTGAWPDALFDTVNDPLELTNLLGTETVHPDLEASVTAQLGATTGFCGEGG